MFISVKGLSVKRSLSRYRIDQNRYKPIQSTDDVQRFFYDFNFDFRSFRSQRRVLKVTMEHEGQTAVCERKIFLKKLKSKKIVAGKGVDFQTI